jgi:hypothetical protein
MGKQGVCGFEHPTFIGFPSAGAIHSFFREWRTLHHDPAFSTGKMILNVVPPAGLLSHVIWPP